MSCGPSGPPARSSRPSRPARHHHHYGSRFPASGGWSMPVQEGYVTTDDGVRLFYQKAGSGTQLVLLPNALYLVDEFSRFTGNRTLVFFDVRNRGRSDQVTDGAKLER